MRVLALSAEASVHPFSSRVVRYLHGKGLARQIEVICSVSGGSILAAHLVLIGNCIEIRKRFRTRQIRSSISCSAT